MGKYHSLESHKENGCISCYGGGGIFFSLENSIQVQLFLARGLGWEAQGRSHESGTSSFLVVSVIVTALEAEASSEFSQQAATAITIRYWSTAIQH